MSAHRALDPQVAGQQVRDALAAVRDPDLGRPVTELGFVHSVSLDGGRVHVHLRLPTYFAAMDLVWLMIADARAAIGGLSWVESVEVCLQGQHGVHQPASRVLDDAARQLRRAAFLIRQHEVVSDLLDRGFRRAELCTLRLADLPLDPEVAVYLHRRAACGLDVDPAAPLLVTEHGGEVTEIEVDGYLAGLWSAVAADDVRGGSCRNPLQTRQRRRRDLG